MEPTGFQTKVNPQATGLVVRSLCLSADDEADKEIISVVDVQRLLEQITPHPPHGGGLECNAAPLEFEHAIFETAD